MTWKNMASREVFCGHIIRNRHIVQEKVRETSKEKVVTYSAILSNNLKQSYVPKHFGNLSLCHESLQRVHAVYSYLTTYL